jgi:hypothetical protein
MICLRFYKNTYLGVFKTGSRPVKARQAVVVSKSLLVSIAATLNAIKLTLYVIAATLLAWLIYEIAK